MKRQASMILSKSSPPEQSSMTRYKCRPGGCHEWTGRVEKGVARTAEASPGARTLLGAHVSNHPLSNKQSGRSTGPRTSTMFAAGGRSVITTV